MPAKYRFGSIADENVMRTQDRRFIVRVL